MTTNTKSRQCAKCSKEIKPGSEYTHQGNVYCCGKCCKKPEVKSTKICDFC